VGVELHRRVLVRAANLIGGGEALAAFLHVPAAHVRMWIHGAAPVPTHVFLRCVDYVLDQQFSDPALRSQAIDTQASETKKPADK
jgi:DNA-binding transcriptional regulator YdaS (Cro superfamily)